MNLNQRINNVLGITDDNRPDALQEGSILNINTMVSDTIRVPEGDYIIAVVDANRCVLISTEANKQHKFEVFKPTLAGFFNPDIHRKVKELPDDSIIAETSEVDELW